MPRKSIQKSQPKDFESRRKNPISLGDDSNIDNDFKPFRIGDTPTGLEFKLGEIRSTADNFVTHKETTEELFVTKIKGNRAGDLYSPQILMQSPDPLANNYGLNVNIFGNGTTFLNATGSGAQLAIESDTLQLYYIGDSYDNAFAWYYGSLGVSGTKLMQLDHEGELSLFSTADEGDYFKIAIGTNGATTISTTDDGGIVGHLTLDIDGDIELNADGGQVTIKDGTATHFLFDCDTTRFRIYDDTNESDFFTIVVGAEGATTINTNDNDGTSGNLTISPDGQLILGAETDIKAALCLGSLQNANTYGATNTDAYFRGRGNKQFIEFDGGNITNIRLQFPTVSCNCVLLLKQDGTGSRTVTNWVAYDNDDNAASGSATVVWAGGSAPTLTTTANYVDILSFYWDATNEIAYGVASLNFAGT